MRGAFIVLLFVALLLSGCGGLFATNPSPTPIPPTAAAQIESTATAEVSSPPPEPTASPESPATAEATPEVIDAPFVEAECQFFEPPGVEVSCGYLNVPEDRSDPDSPMIRLHVAVFPSNNPNPAPDPVVYLEGGPGGNPLEIVALVFDDWFADLLDERDVIIFDQRGTGLSEPVLDCPEETALGYDILDDDLGRDEVSERSVEAALACRNRLRAEGVNLAAYTSAENAADLADLRVALGYDEWNLYGISYGTRLALTTIRDFPEGIRSVTLDSTYPPQASQVDLPANAARAFATLFDACAADAACAAAYPNLEEAFYATVDRLEQSPITAPAFNPLTGRTYAVLLDGETFIGTTFEMLYQSDYIPDLPWLIYAAYSDEEYQTFVEETGYSLFLEEFLSIGMYYSVQCGEEVAFSTRAELVAANADYPRQLGVIGNEYIVDLCTEWDVAAADPRENESVRSDIPTLILAGEYDPITPPSYGEATAANLTQSYFFAFPGLGHGVSVDHPCARRIMLTFLNDPTTAPPSACLADMTGPQFTVDSGE